MKMKNVEDAYPLSPMHQLMLMHSLFASQSDILVNQFRYTNQGRLNAAAFEQGLRVRRRELLERLRRSSDPHFQTIQEIYRIHIPAQHNYRAEPGDMKLILLQSEDPLVNGLQRGWADLSERLETVHFSGVNHSTFLRGDENVRPVADSIKQIVDEWAEEQGQGRRT